jgi:nucleoside-diphosphate-sugar epimerase
LKGVDTVFHLAGIAHDMRDSSKMTELYQKVNVDSTIKLAELASRSGVKNFIFVSTVKAGGLKFQGQSLNEDDQIEPDSIYGQSKREAELRLLEMSCNSKMHISIIRPALVYGPNIKGNLELMLSGIKKGWFPSLPDTGNKISMIHVDDLVRAILLLAQDNNIKGEIYIATDGIPYSSFEIYNTMRLVTGKSIPKWSVPKIFFDFLGILSPNLKYKINKLLGNEFYSSSKLEALGFEARKTLKEMNETDF